MARIRNSRSPEPPRPPAGPRKQPLQARSRRMVEAILEAAARVLGEAGYAAATTNRIAEVAGISVGSLYQYFPNKEALVATLHRRHVRQVRTAAAAAVAQSRGKPLAQGLDAFVRAIWDEHWTNPGLHQVLELEYPARHFLPPSGVLRAELERLLAEHRTDLARPDLRSASAVALDLVRGLVHAAVLDPRRAWLGLDPVREIRRAALGYLTVRDDPVPGDPPGSGPRTRRSR